MYRILSVVVICAVLLPKPALGQVGPMVSASFSVDPDTRWSVAGSAAYRFNRMFSLGTELTWSSLKFSRPNIVDGPVTITYTNVHRELISFTTNVRLDLAEFHRVTPYIVTGGGIATDTTGFTATYTVRPASNAQPETGSVLDSPVYLGLTGGGGVSVRVGERVTIDGDVRGLYMRGHNGQWGRIGVGATYRF
jgi:opacity protein-like surface antigen